MIEHIIILFLIIFQSVFGIGLLLFGTPTFILLGYSFPETLSLLLPISLVISFLQFFFSKVKNSKFIFNFNLFCIPSLVISLYFILHVHQNIDFKFYTSIIIIIFSILSLIKSKIKIINTTNHLSKNIVLIFIGIIHGLTNLGGSLLSIFSTSISKNNKELSRYFISYGYFTMSLVQIIFLFLFRENHYFINNIFYILAAIIIYFPIQKLFKKFKSKSFSTIINLFALIYGLGIFLSVIFN